MNQTRPYYCYTIPFWHLLSHESSFIFMRNMPDGICTAWLKQTRRTQFYCKHFPGGNMWSCGYIICTWYFKSNQSPMLEDAFVGVLFVCLFWQGRSIAGGVTENHPANNWTAKWWWCVAQAELLKNSDCY